MAVQSTVPRVILVGIRGFGHHHYIRLRALQSAGRLRMVALVDPIVAATTAREDELPVFARLADALTATRGAEIVVVASPIGAHFSIAHEALKAGADVLLEKPPVASLAEFHELLETERETGCVVQVGFQSLGSHALTAFDRDAFRLGAITSVNATGLWLRTAAYWARSRWAGRRSLDGIPVVDGVATNPFAHAVVTALRIAGCRAEQSVAHVDVELYRANAIDSDDTSVIRITGVNGRRITCALTLCAPEVHKPLVTAVGGSGSASFSYTTDEVRAEAGGRSESRSFDRDDLLTNLLDFRENGAPLIVPLADTGAFMRVLEKIRLADEPMRIDHRAIDWRGEGEERHPVVDGIESWITAAAASGKTFSELGAPWAFTGEDAITAQLRIGEKNVADYRDGAGTIGSSSPRPYLHPIRSLAGVTVSAHHTADHDWHLGLGFAVQDANGTNFWGGRTYVQDRGYVWRDDHGHITGELPAVHSGTLAQTLTWLAASGQPVIHEQRRLRWKPLSPAAWALEADFTLSPAGRFPVELASPGTKGRERAGYGGFFWRLPTCSEASIFTAVATGEDAVHGHPAQWIAWAASFSAAPGECGDATLVLTAADSVTAHDPWFVRQHSYPGIGSAVAWDTPTVIPSEGRLRRTFRVAVCDGRLDRAGAARISDALHTPW
jgi:predicted dehydrogenase